MDPNKNNFESPNSPSQMTNPHRGGQGVDKAPGEEDREGPIEDVVNETQRGQGKEDGDPSQRSDAPINEP